MKLFVPEEIEQYAHDHTCVRPPLFDELREYTLQNVPVPQMQVGRVEGTLLKTLAALVGAKRILEIGTYTGYSALCMAEALPADGELITCDHNAEVTAVAQRFFDKSPHGKKITINVGDALETVKKLPRDGSIDMAFIDADKSRYPEYYEEILPRLRAGGIIVIDNVLWSGEVLDPQSDDAKGIAAVNDRVQSDDRVENVLLPVRDGVMLARKL
jgi:caffeoyl-CoA O-methyltransferase